MSRHLAMIRDELQGLGLLEMVADPDTTDLLVNEDGSVWRQGLVRGMEVVPGLVLQADQLESWLGTVAAAQGTVLTAERPILEATLPLHEVRLQALVPPVVLAPVLALRKPPARLLTLDDLVERGSLPRSVAEMLASAFEGGATCVVAGGVGTGKTTLANALLAELLAQRPEERVVILEEGAREVHARGSNVTRLLTSESAGVSMTALVRAALRLNPNRILIGEVRGAEALDFIRAANTGHPGSLVTVHANTAADALARLDMLAQEAGVPSQLQRIAEAVHLVVFVARRGLERRVAEVVRVEGLDGRRRPEISRLYAATGSSDARTPSLPLNDPPGGIP